MNVQKRYEINSTFEEKYFATKTQRLKVTQRKNNFEERYFATKTQRLKVTHQRFRFIGKERIICISDLVKLSDFVT